MSDSYKTLVASLLSLGGAVHAADGLAVPESAWQHWQARVSVGTAESSTRVLAASLLGDYYFRGLKFGSTSGPGGFRATSGLVLGAGSALLGAAGVPVRLSDGMSLGHMAVSHAAPVVDAADGGATLPYLGFGYTSLAAAGGWGFTADVGFVAQNPMAAVRFGRALLGPQRLDDAIRNLRLMPVLQLGVRYRF